MLRLIEPTEALKAAAAMHPIYPKFIEQQFGWDRTDEPIKYLTSEAGPEHLLACYRGAFFMLLGSNEQSANAAEDIVNERFEPANFWPGDAVRAKWQEQKPPRPFVEISAFGLEWTKVLAELPVEIEPEHEEGGHGGAYFYWLEGKPRFQERIKHSCRVATGLELYERMRQATVYDKSGEYTKQCLEYAPSFVCEVEGEPVCWSCTHLNDMLGMIYTPEEHRRQGYAMSLAAFQIDYVLKRDGFASCYVMAYNNPSRQMMSRFGASCLPEPMAWRKLWLGDPVNPEGSL